MKMETPLQRAWRVRIKPHSVWAKLNLVAKRIWQDRVSYLMAAPYVLAFVTFILLPVLGAIGLSFTFYNMIETPRYVGLMNYIYLFTEDDVFMTHVLPNTFTFAVIVGPGGYLLAFLLAWVIAQLPRRIRTVFSLALYTPSMAAAVAMSTIWLVLFSGDRVGYLNSFLLGLGVITEPINWLHSTQWLMPVMIIVTLWSSMGVGFLAMLAGILNVDPQLYEAGKIDGVKNRMQEIYYITIPSVKPQMLFGAVMAIVNTLQAGAIGVTLSGQNPTPNYAGQLILNHIDDFAFQRFEMGYAAAISVVLLIIVYISSKLAWALFGPKEGE
jgi:multiple sugar transport system permease protein